MRMLRPIIAPLLALATLGAVQLPVAPPPPARERPSAARYDAYVPPRTGSGGHKHPRFPRGFNGHQPAGAKLARKAAEGKL